MKSKNNICWWYVLALFIPTYLLQLVIFLTGGLTSSLFLPLTLTLMWFPAIVAIVFRFITKEGFRNVGWGIRKWWYIPIAIFVPLIVASGGSFLLITLNWGTLSSQFFTFKNGLMEAGPFLGWLVFGNQPQSISFFIFNSAITLILVSLINSIFTFGEEFGWRGYLQEKLLRKFGLNIGLIVLGLIWGYWHLPIILMGYNFPDYPVLGALLLMPLSTIFFGIFEGWLYLRSKSIWMPVFAHASINATGGILLIGVIMQRSELLKYFVWGAAWAIVAALCLISMNRKKPSFFQEMDVTEGNTA